MSDIPKLSGALPLDLHNFRPCDVPSLVEEFVWTCTQEKRIFGEIIHGKGRGSMRALVHSSLSGNPAVASFQLGSSTNQENWGMTTFQIQAIIKD